MELAEQIVERRERGWELAMEPQANIVCFRYLPRDFENTEEENAFTLRLRHHHLEQGPQYIVQTRFGGKVWLRCTLMNPLTEASDLKGLLDRLESLGEGA